MGHRLKQLLFQGDRMIATILAVIFVFYAWEASTLSRTHFQDKIGPGTFPELLAAFGLIMIGFFFFDVFRGKGGTYEKCEGFIGEVKGVAILFMSIAYVFLLDLLSYPIATFLFMTVAVKFLGERTWWVSALVGIGMTGFCYAFFVMFLDINFSTGDFWLMIRGE
ncbi:MAG: tripartite tricarboxylate transporter TctB family protein [Rhodospirillales bacterium]